MGYQEQHQLTYEPGIQIKVKMAMIKAALDIISEDASGKVAVDQKRHDLATAVLNNVEAYENRFRLAVVSNPAINDKSTDDDVQFTVNSVWNGIAGVTGPEAA